MGNPIEDRIEWWLEEYITPASDHRSSSGGRQFICKRVNEQLYIVTDKALALTTHLHRKTVLQWHWNPGRWYRRHLGKVALQLNNDSLKADDAQYEGLTRLFESDRNLMPVIAEPPWPGRPRECLLYGIQVAQGRYPVLQHNSAVTRDMVRAIPKPVVVVTHIRRRPAWVLIDTGSLADFMSLTTAEQLKFRLTTLEKPLTIQLAVQGSRSKVNYGTTVRFQYQGTEYEQYFDVINLQNYDLILGTPFLYQHGVTVGLNPPRVILEHLRPLPLKGEGVTTLESWVAEVT
jgi:hypothetical protein